MASLPLKPPLVLSFSLVSLKPPSSSPFLSSALLPSALLPFTDRLHCHLQAIAVTITVTFVTTPLPLYQPLLSPFALAFLPFAGADIPLLVCFGDIPMVSLPGGPRESRGSSRVLSSTGRPSQMSALGSDCPTASTTTLCSGRRFSGWTLRGLGGPKSEQWG